VDRLRKEPVSEQKPRKSCSHGREDTPDYSHEDGGKEIKKKHIVEAEAAGKPVEQPGQER
jgi:hypothetical protein